MIQDSFIGYLYLISFNFGELLIIGMNKGILSREIREIIKGKEFLHSLSILYLPDCARQLTRNMLLQGIEVEEYSLVPFKKEVENVLYFNSSILIEESGEGKYIIRIES